uniref:Uncharacterized protein n=1 Tax=Nothoprocta perdicaria TaxID=30464 RepID=A0A8C6YT99_NOTPE
VMCSGSRIRGCLILNGSCGHPDTPPSDGSDALPMISVIVVIFVLLAIFIIIVVHYGPHLRTIQITLYHEPMPQDLDGVQYCQRELDSKDTNGESYQCSCKHHLPCGNAEPNVIEITYL